MATNTKTLMRFVIWMQAKPLLGASVTWQEITEHWAIDRATAYRWLSHYWAAQVWHRKRDECVQSAG